MDSSSGGGRSDDSSLKQTHLSAVSSATLSCSGPKMLSRSAIEGFRVETSASVDASEEQSHRVRRDETLMGEEILFNVKFLLFFLSTLQIISYKSIFTLLK